MTAWFVVSQEGRSRILDVRNAGYGPKRSDQHEYSAIRPGRCTGRRRALGHAADPFFDMLSELNHDAPGVVQRRSPGLTAADCAAGFAAASGKPCGTRW